MFLWKTPRGLKTFGQTAQEAEATAVLAANQGLYNGFLAAGLAVSLVTHDAVRTAFAIFFLSCVIIAGIYGGATVSRRITIVQSAPAALALVLFLLSLR
jgi:putative membrane protein